MKKENIIGIVIYLLVFAVAIIYGFTILQTHFQNSAFNEQIIYYAIYIIVSVFSGILSAGLLEEFGHLLGAKVGGYKIVSWCLLYFTIYLDKDKRKFKFGSYNGLTGETKIVPNYEKKENPNPYPYLLYGPIFLLAWIVACVVMFFNFKNYSGIQSDVAYYFLTIGVISSLVFIYNIVPAKLDSLTDGYRLTQIKKDIPAFNELLAAENGGVSTQEKVTIISEETTKKPAKFIPEVALNDVIGLLAKHDYDGAFKVLGEINEHEQELSGKVEVEVKSQYLYAVIMSKDKLEIDAYYDKEVPFALRREFSNFNTLPVIRTYLLTAGLLDNSQSESLLALKKVIKAYKNVPANRKHDELVLFNEALDKVIEAHPKWEEISNYKLYE